MYTKGEKLYADAFKYLKHKNRNEVAFSIIGNEQDYTELSLYQISIERKGNLITFQNGLFAFMIEDFTETGIKKEIIKTRYSNDDQIAIILNKDLSDEKLENFNRMQEWRNFAETIAKACKFLI